MAGRADGQLLPGAIQPAPAGGRPGGPLLEHLHVLEVQFIRTSINHVQCGMSANFSHATITKCQGDVTENGIEFLATCITRSPLLWLMDIQPFRPLFSP